MTQIVVASIDNIREKTTCGLKFLGEVETKSEQTSLLDLNSNIETVRAGEHGKGLSIVAQEVVKLAENTTAIAIRGLMGGFKVETEKLQQALY